MDKCVGDIRNMPLSCFQSLDNWTLEGIVTAVIAGVILLFIITAILKADYKQ
jgi:hypothetical protein